MSQLPFIKGRYVAGRPTRAAGSRLAAHLKYNQYRKLGQQETRESRYIFSQESDHIYRQDAIRDVMDQASRNVLYHKIILSPGEHEHIGNFRLWTRNVMHDLEDRKGVKLHWYAVVQAHPREHTDEPHIHLVLASGGEDPLTGQRKMVRMEKGDYAFLRERGRQHSNFEFYQQQEQQLDELNTQDTTTFHGSKTPDPDDHDKPVFKLAHSLDDAWSIFLDTSLGDR